MINLNLLYKFLLDCDIEKKKKEEERKEEERKKERKKNVMGHFSINYSKQD